MLQQVFLLIGPSNSNQFKAIRKTYSFFFFLHFMRGAQRSAAGNQTRKRDVAELCGFLFLAWRHIPQLTGAIGPSRRTPWPLRVLRLFAWDSHSVRTVLGWTPETFSFYWLFTFARMPENHRGFIELFWPHQTLLKNGLLFKIVRTCCQ